MIEPAPRIDGVTVTPAAGPKPEPESFSTLTVNVCGDPTSFVPDAVMLIRASAHCFWFWTTNAP